MIKKLGFNSRIKDLYDNPVGRDIINKLLLQLNKKKILITNPLVGNLRLKTLADLTKKSISREFYQSVLDLLNSEQDIDKKNIGRNLERKWWKEAVLYQIYPRSFQDSDGDGIGDINGICSRLDYLKELGIDAIWLSPIYDSPNDDNGYDIRDYYAIMKEFGTMEDFDRLLNEVHQRGMKLIMDLVINHTSDEHTWFVKALEGVEEYQDYYHFVNNEDGNPPNNWTSFFSGSAWNYYEKLDSWALHLFSKKQMDLNWENPHMRQDIITMIKWWLEKGVDGFRLDVINYISKKEGLPDGNEIIGELMEFYGVEHYFYGPRLHEYLRQLKKEAFEPYQAFTVGETPGIGMEMGKLLTANHRRELDMIFSFDHLETPGHVRFDDYAYDLNYYKEYMIEWMENYSQYGSMSLFYENHDNPRMISKVNMNPAYHTVIGKLLAMMQLTLKGTPFIYQGQEIGAINQKFTSIDDFRDVESINLYNELTRSQDEQSALKRVLSGSRDHARTPMQWDKSKHAGFSDGKPWIDIHGDYKKHNVEAELEDEDSILNFYRKLIKLRKKNEAFIYGDIKILDKKRKNSFVYLRRYKSSMFLIECNLSDDYILKKKKKTPCKLILSNYKESSDRLRPYEANLYKVMKKK
ncbi:MAG: alpha-glucosidase [Anaerolineaceae bacterium]|nr:MAG: alpha-glucosidase [Anaerolineaceae bacterium]